VLSDFLDKKPLYYNEIDYSRMPRVYETIQNKLKLPKLIHLIGTNGKGTTGRFLATALHSLGFSTGHYTSPHIIEFNERIWMNGSVVIDDVLNTNHLKLLHLLSPKDADSLSYFEYTTLLAIMTYQECDYVVLEAGLGGEHDATAVFAKELTLVTPIDIDHEAFLGNTVEKIARTKLNAVDKKAILAEQSHRDVYKVADKIAQDKNVSIHSYSEFIQESDSEKVEIIAQNLNLVPYLVENLKLAIAALNSLGLTYEVDDFNESRLFGRLSRVGENILLDVGHNVLAAKSIYNSLKEDKYILVYNSYKDKNYKEILTILKPIILEVELIDIDDDRIESSVLMQSTLDSLEIKHKKFQTIDEEKNYLVFGSFCVVEAFLKDQSE